MTKQKISFAKIFFWVSVISLILIYTILWIQMITSQKLRTGTDFMAFYSAGTIANSNGIASVYNISLYKTFQQNLIGFEVNSEQILFYNHLPYLIPLLQVIITDSYTISFHRWALFLSSLYALGTWQLVRLTMPKEKVTWRMFAALMTFLPLFMSIINGQDTVFLYIGAVIYTIGLLRNNDLTAGMGLGLVTVRPHIALTLAIPFLFRRKRVFFGFIISSTTLAIFSLLILGVEGTLGFINTTLISVAGELHVMKEPVMFNMIGLLHRVIPGLGALRIRNIGWATYLFSIITLSIIWVRAKKIRTSHLNLAFIFSLFFAPHLHYHDLTLLIIPIFLTLKSGKLPISQKKLPLAPLAISLLLIFTQPIPFLYYSLPYLLMLSLIILTQKEFRTHKNIDLSPNA